LLAEYELASVVHSQQQLAMLSAYPRRGGLSVWLKLNTGMNRLGFAPEHFPQTLEVVRRHPAVGEVTLMTHFAHADDSVGVTAQLERFTALTSAYRLPRSLANSAALLRYPQTHADWVRPGISLYGASPFAEVSAEQLDLRPVMTLASEVISVTELKAGDCVGYGGSFRAERAMRIGTVACGYADGYPRHAPTGTPVLVDGRRTRTLGRVSMDMLSVDLSEIPEAGIGSRVVLWGEGMPVNDVARAADTISYELLCALARRVPIK
jgi:alanine racemase